MLAVKFKAHALSEMGVSHGSLQIITFLVSTFSSVIGQDSCPFQFEFAIMS